MIRTSQDLDAVSQCLLSLVLVIIGRCCFSFHVVRQALVELVTGTRNKILEDKSRDSFPHILPLKIMLSTTQILPAPALSSALGVSTNCSSCSCFFASRNYKRWPNHPSISHSGSHTPVGRSIRPSFRYVGHRRSSARHHAAPRMCRF